MGEENRELEQSSLDKLAADLLQGIPVHNGQVSIELEKGTNLNGWEIVTVHDFNLTVKNPEHGLFGKAFLPEANQYAEESFKATQELVKLPLSTPVLPPVHFYSNEKQGAMIMYVLGEVVEGINFYGDLYTSDERQDIAEILDQHGLTHLPDEKVPLIRVGGKQYLADPFNDSGPEIENYNREHGFSE